ncbi:cation diffusion facilitator family transporter [uncultured Bacteroides sp.]|uniref:cation diffusion facilitator family transporter n=1 Tax=uncultured Bacteroides sp. TaxID=162156 RepID=UPI002AAB4530|nr:cation diffusion facilitator family transporter [uncultured Bacteroides sp.]
MKQDLIKQKVQGWIVLFSLLILIGKFIAFYVTNSVGILTDAMESIVNVIAGLISFISLRYAAKPKDKGHPFGHGKIELISASIEGLLIMIAGGMIIYEGIRRLFEPATIGKLDIGIAVVAVAGLINYVMGWYSVRMGKKYDSIALVAGGKHLQSDTYSTIGLVIGLFLLYYTRLSWIDSALAMIFGSIIVITGILILRKTTANLMDKADEEVLHKMMDVISAVRKPEWVDIHNMKVIKYGSYLFVDCDLTLPWFYNITDGHQACDELKDILSARYSDRLLVTIHSDPCLEKHCSHCQMVDCTYRKTLFVAPLKLTLENITESDEERKE